MTIEERVKSKIVEVNDFPIDGIKFKDITPILADPVLVHDIVGYLAECYKDMEIDAIAGIESRGFWFGVQIARQMGIPFIPIRKEGKLPRETVVHAYALEYGTNSMEAHVDSVKPGWNVLIHDDLLATGGTAASSGEIIHMLRGTVAGYSFLVNLTFLNGVEKLKGYSGKIHSLVEY